jgi:hypothetical protein
MSLRCCCCRFLLCITTISVLLLHVCNAENPTVAHARQAPKARPVGWQDTPNDPAHPRHFEYNSRTSTNRRDTDTDQPGVDLSYSVDVAPGVHSADVEGGIVSVICASSPPEGGDGDGDGGFVEVAVVSSRAEVDSWSTPFVLTSSSTVGCDGDDGGMLIRRIGRVEWIGPLVARFWVVGTAAFVDLFENAQVSLSHTQPKEPVPARSSEQRSKVTLPPSTRTPNVRAQVDEPHHQPRDTKKVVEPARASFFRTGDTINVKWESGTISSSEYWEVSLYCGNSGYSCYYKTNIDYTARTWSIPVTAEMIASSSYRVIVGWCGSIYCSNYESERFYINYV